MPWITWLIVGLLLIYILRKVRVLEGFAVMRPRADIGLASEGWGEEAGFERDLRYAEGFVDIQGLGQPTDFCRAVRRKTDPQSLHIACALGLRDGMDTLEYTTRTVRDGFRMSRDDYFRADSAAYCRIVQDVETHEWYVSCAVAGRTGFRTVEERDVSPPPAIQSLLIAYGGCMGWFRWHDDDEDSTHSLVMEAHPGSTGAIVVPGPTDVGKWKTRGLQLNRDGGPQSYLRFGRPGDLVLENTRKLRAISMWVWWDMFERGATLIECKGEKNRLWLGVEGGGVELQGNSREETTHAQEVRPAAIIAIGQLTEPPRPPPVVIVGARYVFEMWDDDHLVMRLEAPVKSASLQCWQHVVITTTDNTAFWPTWQMWVNGKLIASRSDGRMCTEAELNDNTVGRGVRGCLKDLRLYERGLTGSDIDAMRTWGEGRLHP